MAGQLARQPIATPRRITAPIAALGVAVLLVGALNPKVALAALITGVLNTAAGGGAFVLFFALVAMGVPALTAHATSQLTTPASFTSAAGLVRTHRPGWTLVTMGCAGASVGIGVLALTPPGVFRAAAPYVLLPAAALVVVQEPLKRRVRRLRRTPGRGTVHAATFLCGVYAGLIGVGTGTLALVVLGMAPRLWELELPALLRTRNVLLLAVAVVVAIAVACTGLADWRLAAQIVLPAALGGWLGIGLVGRLPASLLQGLIVSTALVSAAWMALL